MSQKTKKLKKSPMPANRHLTGFRGPDPKVGKATQFQPGSSGNPGGRPRQKPVLEALQKAIADDPKILAGIAKKVLKHAEDSLGHLEVVRDMLDGKPDSEDGAE